MKLVKNLLLSFRERCAFNSYVTGNYEKAYFFFKKIIEIAPERVGVHYNLGLVLIALKEYNSAEASLLREMEFHGDSYQVLKTLGDLYYVWGQRQKTRTFYERALEYCVSSKDRKLLQTRLRKCSNPALFSRVIMSHDAYEKGVILMGRNQYRMAMESFEHAVDLDGTNFYALNDQGTLLMNQQHDVSRARNCFDRALKWVDLPIIKKNLVKLEQLEKQLLSSHG